ARDEQRRWVRQEPLYSRSILLIAASTLVGFDRLLRMIERGEHMCYQRRKDMSGQQHSRGDLMLTLFGCARPERSPRCIPGRDALGAHRAVAPRRDPCPGGLCARCCCADSADVGEGDGGAAGGHGVEMDGIALQ